MCSRSSLVLSLGGINVPEERNIKHTFVAGISDSICGPRKMFDKTPLAGIQLVSLLSAPPIDFKATKRKKPRMNSLHNSSSSSSGCFMFSYNFAARLVQVFFVNVCFHEVESFVFGAFKSTRLVFTHCEYNFFDHQASGPAASGFLSFDVYLRCASMGKEAPRFARLFTD